MTKGLEDPCIDASRKRYFFVLYSVAQTPSYTILTESVHITLTPRWNKILFVNAFWKSMWFHNVTLYIYKCLRSPTFVSDVSTSYSMAYVTVPGQMSQRRIIGWLLVNQDNQNSLGTLYNRHICYWLHVTGYINRHLGLIVQSKGILLGTANIYIYW